MKCCHTHNIHIRNFYDCIQQFHIEIIILLRSRVFFCAAKREKKKLQSLSEYKNIKLHWDTLKHRFFQSFFFIKNIIKWNMKWNTVRYAYTIYNVMFRRINEIRFCFLLLLLTAAAMMGRNKITCICFSFEIIAHLLVGYLVLKNNQDPVAFLISLKMFCQNMSSLHRFTILTLLKICQSKV